MSESVSLPALGESVTEGTVTRWLKNVGDRVEVDEPLLEVSTDKVDTEIPSPVAGVIEEILVQEDETVDVGTALVRIGDGSGSAPSGDATPVPTEEVQSASTAPEPVSEQPVEAGQLQAVAADLLDDARPRQQRDVTAAGGQHAADEAADAAGACDPDRPLCHRSPSIDPVRW